MTPRIDTLICVILSAPQAQSKDDPVLHFNAMQRR